MADNSGRRVTGRFSRDVMSAKMQIEVEGTEEQVGNILAKLALVVAAVTESDLGEEFGSETLPVDAPAPRSAQPVDSDA